MRIIDVVKFNDRHAYVFDKIPAITYIKHDEILVGSDDSEIIIGCFYYMRPLGRNGGYAFGGRKFNLPTKDGSVTHCWGQYWDGGVADCEKVLGF